MQGLPILFLIIAVVSIFSNYKKAAEKQQKDQKARAAAGRRAAGKETPAGVEKPVRTDDKKNAPNLNVLKVSGNGLKNTPSVAAKPKISAKAMRQAVITSEILGKPVSLRDE